MPECSPIVFNDTIQLPEYVEAQFSVIPDGIDIIEISDELEKLLKPLLRAFQIFRGQPGKWVTFRGRPLFLKAKSTTRLRDFLEEALEKTEVESIGQSVGPGINPFTLKNGLRGIHRTGVKGKAELQAYNISKAMGMDDLLPVTVQRGGGRDPFKFGSSQLFAPGKTEPGIALEWIRGSRRSLPKVASKDMGRAAAFDYLTGTTDRHAFNYLIRGKRLKLIDHEDILAPSIIARNFDPLGMSSDLFFEAARRKIPIRDIIGPVNKVKWETLLPSMGIPKKSQAGLLDRLRFLNEAAERGDDFSALAGTPILPGSKATLRTVERVTIDFTRDFV